MFMKLIPHVGDLQIHDYNQAIPSSQRIQYDEMTAFSRDTSRRFSEIKNNGIILATNSNGMHWEIKTEQSHNSVSCTRSQPIISSNQRSLMPLNENFRLSKRYHDSSCSDENNFGVSINNDSAISAMSDNQENMPVSSTSISDLQPLEKRRRTQAEVALSFTSPDKIQDINVDLLNDDTLSPFTNPLVPDYFVVQTPSKTLNASDQQSFHLSSPISHFNTLGIPTSNPKRKNTNSSFKPRALFRDSASSGPNSSSLVFPPPRPPVVPKTVGNSGYGSQIRRFNVMPSTSAPRQQLTSTVNYPLHRPIPSNSDSIAISTAKMTVWNRMAANSPIAPIRTSSPVITIPQQSASYQRLQPPNPSPAKHRLTYPVTKNPEFTIRRILQKSHSRKWRRFALGENRSAQIMVQLARQMLGKQ
nr:serine rich repeat protein [Hymenolepis microstoma]